jgi:hypothetical protein
MGSISPEQALLALLEEEDNEKQKMEEEIEELIKKNNIEMEKAVQEVKDSYKDDIAGFEGK